MMLDVDRTVFEVFAVSVAFLVIKVLAMGPLTARQRFKHKTFISPEDAGLQPGAKALPQGGNPDIERVRRAHRNDVENIPVFIMMAAVYMVVASPTALNAKVTFYGFTAARFIHTFSYINEMQPARALAYFGGVIPTVYMAVRVLITLLL